MFLKNYKYTCTKKYENPNQMGMQDIFSNFKN